MNTPLRTEGTIVGWYPERECGYIRTAHAATPHFFRLRDLRSDCPPPTVGMTVQFESVPVPGQAPRALAVSLATQFMPLLAEVEPLALPEPTGLVADPSPARRPGTAQRRLVLPQLAALAMLAATGWWLWTHPLG